MTLNDNIYGPLEGTPMPPGPAPAAPAAANSSGPSVAIATYDPVTGQFATPDGSVARQTTVTEKGPQGWSDLLPTG